MESPESGMTFAFKVIQQVLLKITEYGFYALILVLIAGGIYFFLFMRRKRVEVLNKAKKNHIKNAKAVKDSGYPHMKKLYRIPVDLTKLSKNEKGGMVDYLTHNNGIPIGTITGFNIIDRRATSDTLKGLRDGDSDVEDRTTTGDKDIEEIDKELGRSIYVITYTERKGFLKGLFGNEQILLVFEDQMINFVDYMGGSVLVAGYGIDNVGGFNILTGLAGSYPYLLAEFKSMADQETIVGIMNSTKDMVDKAVDLDSTLEKTTKIMGAATQMFKGRGKDEK